MKTINKLIAILMVTVLLCACAVTLTVYASTDPKEAYGDVDNKYDAVVIKGNGDKYYVFSDPDLDGSDTYTFSDSNGKEYDLKYKKKDSKKRLSVLEIEDGEKLSSLKLSSKYDKEEIAVLFSIGGSVYSYSSISVTSDKNDTLELEGVPEYVTTGAAVINTKNNTVIAIVYENDGSTCSALKADALNKMMPGKLSTVTIVLIVVGVVAAAGAAYYVLRSKGSISAKPNGGQNVVPNFAPNGGQNFAPNGGQNFAPNGMQDIPGQQPAAPVQNEAFRTRVCIRGETGYFAGKKFELDGSVTMGRQSDRCNICYPSDAKGISGLHCKLRPAGSQIELVDLGSSFGTFVNGQPIMSNTPFILNPGDRFWLANEENSFVVYQ